MDEKKTRLTDSMQDFFENHYANSCGPFPYERTREFALQQATAQNQASDHAILLSALNSGPDKNARKPQEATPEAQIQEAPEASSKKAVEKVKDAQDCPVDNGTDNQPGIVNGITADVQEDLAEQLAKGIIEPPMRRAVALQKNL